MATAGSIVLDLLMRTGSFETDTKRAEKRLREMGKEAERMGKIMGAAIGTGVTLAATAIGLWTRETAKTAVEMDRLAKLSNVGVVEFQKLSAAASRVGVDHGKLADTFKDVQDKIGDFLQTGGGPLADFFENIAPKVGLTADAMANMAGPDALGAYVKALEAANLSQSEMTFYMEAIASDSALLLPLLKNGAAGFREYGDQAERVGSILGEDVIRAAAQLEEQTWALEQSFKGLRMQVGAELLDELQDVTGELAALAENGDLARHAADLLGGVMSAGVGILKGYENAVARTSIAIGVLAGAAQGLQQAQANFGLGGLFNPGSVSGGLDQVRKAFADGQRELDWLTAQQNKPRPMPASFYADAAPDQSQWYGVDRPRPTRPTGGGGGSRSNAAADALRDQLEAQRALAEQVAKTMEAHTDFDNTLEDLRAELGGPLAQAELDHKRALEDITALAVAGEVEDRDLAAAKQLLDEQYRRVTEAIKEQRTPVEQMLEDLEHERQLIGKTREEQELLNAARWLGTEAATAQGQAALEAVAANQQMREFTDRQAEAMDGLRDSARGFLYDLKEGVGIFDALENAAERFLDVLFDIAAQQVVANMFGKQGDAGGGTWGDAIGGILGAAFGGSYAQGGDVFAKRPILVGEQGPEMFVPRTAGTIVPAGATAQMMQGNGRRTGDQTLNFYVSGNVDRRSTEQIALERRREQLESATRNG